MVPRAASPTSKPLTPKRLVMGVVALLFIAALGVVIAYSWRGVARVIELHTDKLPDFVAAPGGPRAPRTDAMGARVGWSSYEQVTAMLEGWGTACEDTSMRALMQKVRDAKKREIAEAEARGEDVDGITGASMVNYRSKKERNPQVRLMCKGDSDVLKDRARMPSSGRALYVFDSPEHPLRHASFRRNHKNHPAALDDVMESVASLIAVYGQPHEATALPEEQDGRVKFPPYQRYRFAWSWADLRVEVSAINLNHAIDINEIVEVPWPIEADAPQRATDQNQIARQAVVAP